MTFLETRISITQAERALLMPRLIALANGLANASNGVYPHRHALDRIDPEGSNIYNDQCYELWMANRVHHVKDDLRDSTSTRKPYFDVFEVSTAALALRVSGTLARQAGSTLPAKEMKALSKKLELHRKRAQRLAIGKVGKQAFAELAKRWRLHLAWVRYNLLRFKVAKLAAWNNKPLMREQRACLVTMIKRSLAEHLCNALPAEEVARMALLANNALRRGRMTMTLRELLNAGRAGRDLLFAFVDKRVELVPLSGLKVETGRLMMERASRFEDFIKGKKIDVAPC
jgi:hypothetical protein